MVCHQCGSSNNDSLAFCKKCGASLHRGESRTGDAPTTTEVSQPTAMSGSPSHAAAMHPVIYANFGWRLLAVFIDWILSQTVTFATLLPVVAALTIEPGLGLEPATIRIILGVVSVTLLVFLGWLYEAFMVSSSYQATFGKLAVGIVVTDMEGRRISFWRATGRLVGKHLSTIPLYAGYLIQPFTEKRQALHDMLAGCLVLRKVPR